MAKDRATILMEKREKIDKELAAIQAKEKAKARKIDTRLKILIGAGIMADVKKHPDHRKTMQNILDKATTAKRDRDLLKEWGWLPEEEEKPTSGQ